jgi:hypothetical protein
MNKELDDFLDYIKNGFGEDEWIPLYKDLNRCYGT